MSDTAFIQNKYTIKRLKEKMNRDERKEINQKAIEAGISKTSLWRYSNILHNSPSSIPHDKLKAIAEIFGTTVDSLETANSKVSIAA